MKLTVLVLSSVLLYDISPLAMANRNSKVTFQGGSAADMLGTTTTPKFLGPSENEKLAIKIETTCQNAAGSRFTKGQPGYKNCVSEAKSRTLLGK